MRQERPSLIHLFIAKYLSVQLIIGDYCPQHPDVLAIQKLVEKMKFGELQTWSVMITDDHFDDHWWSDNFNRLQTWSLIDQNRSVNISQFWSIFQTWSLFDDLTLSFSDRQNLARETYLWLDVYSDEEICEQFDISNIDVKAK